MGGPVVVAEFQHYILNRRQARSYLSFRPGCWFAPIVPHILPVLNPSRVGAL